MKRVLELDQNDIKEAVRFWAHCTQGNVDGVTSVSITIRNVGDRQPQNEATARVELS